jgi:hypothetical protein
MFLLYHDLIEITVVWDMILYLEDSTNISEEPAASFFRVLLPCNCRQYVPLKQWYLSTTCMCYQYQKTVILIPNIMRISHLMTLFLSVTPNEHKNQFLSWLQYSQLPVIWCVWGMGCASYMNLLVAWREHLQKPNSKSKHQTFPLFLT